MERRVVEGEGRRKRDGGSGRCDHNWGNPAQPTRMCPKERKKAERAASLEQAEKPEEPKQGKSVPDPMQSTTGRKLVPSGPVEIEVDFGDSATKTGGRVITASSKLDSLLEELEEELLTSDMAHSAVEEVISTLKANLIGTRLTGVKKLDIVLEETLRNTQHGKSKNVKQDRACIAVANCVQIESQRQIEQAQEIEEAEVVEVVVSRFLI